MAKKKNVIIKADKDNRPKGARPSVAKWIRKANRRDYLDNELSRKLNQIKALKRRKKVVLTIRNPNPNETNKKFIRVNAHEVWPGATKTYFMKTKD